MKKLILIIVAVMMAVTTMATSLTDGLVGYWPFDGDAKDYSGNGNHGTICGVTSVADRHGNSDSAYKFGTGKYISVAANSQVNAILDFTLAFWVKITSYDGQPEKWVALISKGSSSRQFGLQFAIGTNGTPFFEIQAYEKHDFAGFDFNKWMHVAVTRKGEEGNLYINGRNVSSVALSSSPTINSGNLEIGRDAPGAMEYLQGLMDEVYLYNRSLSEQEVLAIYNEGLKICTVTFDANGGEGSMDALKVLKGNTQTLPTNKFKLQGSVFQGWQDVKGSLYKQESEIPVNSDMTLYAVWANPALALTAESADWSEGSITLRCEDSNTSGTAHEYTLEYKNASGVWEEVDGAKNVAANKGQDASGQEVWVAKLTDTTYSSRLGGIPPVKYRVKDETGRASAECVTRNRHGIFVGVGEFVKDANSMNNLAIDNGEFSGTIRLLTSPGAKYSDVKHAFEAVADRTKDKPGDICVIYFSTHGGRYNKTTIGHLVLDDRPPESEDPKKQGYHEGLLAKHIRLLDPDKKGVGVVCIISACYSGTFLDDDNGLKECSAVTSWCHREDLGENVAWITAANAETTANSIFTDILLDYGWKRGWALKDNKNMMSFLDLFDCAKKLYDPIVKKLEMSGCEKRKESVLRNIIAGNAGAIPDFSLVAPGKPVGLSASKDRSDVVRVEWTQGAGGMPDEYIVLRKFKETGEAESCYSGIKNNFKELPEIASQMHPMQYAVAALNGAGVGITDGFEEGWRTINIYSVTFDNNLAVLSPPKTVKYIEAGGSLTEELRKATDLLSGVDVSNYEFMGWKARKTDSLNVVSRRLDGSWIIPTDIIVNCDLEYYADWVAKQTYGMTQNWLEGYQTISTASNGDIARAAAITAANGCRTVGECYALGIDPEDPDDDLKIAEFKMKDGKPEITLNHTKDGSGNSYEDRVKILGKAELTDAEWQEVPPEGNPAHRFFKVGVEMP